MSISLYRMRIQWHKWLDARCVCLIRRIQRFVLSFRFFFFSNISFGISNAKTFLLRIQSIAWKRDRKPNVYRSSLLVISSNREEYIVEGVDYTWLPEHIIESWSHAAMLVWKQHKNTPKIRKKRTERKLFLFDSPSAATTMRTACDLLTHSLLRSHLSHFRQLHNTLDKFDEGRSMAVSVASSRSLYSLHILRDFKVVQVRVNCRFVWP